MPAPEALSRDKHEAILDAAGRLFDAHGFEGASMSAITLQSGVSKGTVYHHFGSKAGLFGAFVRRECELTLQPLFATIDGTGDGREALRDIGRRMLTLLVSPIGLLVNRVIMAEAGQFPELAEAFYASGPATALATMEKWLRSRDASGLVADPAFAAEQFFALCSTQAVMKRQLRLTAEVSDRDIERIIDEAVEMFLGAYPMCE